jgi:hypothetical protein
MKVWAYILEAFACGCTVVVPMEIVWKVGVKLVCMWIKSWCNITKSIDKDV